MYNSTDNWPPKAPQAEYEPAAQQYLELLKTKPSATGIRGIDKILEAYPGHLEENTHRIWDEVLYCNYKIFDKQIDKINSTELDPATQKQLVNFIEGIKKIYHDFYVNRYSDYYADRNKCPNDKQLLDRALHQFSEIYRNFGAGDSIAQLIGISKKILSNCPDSVEKVEAKIADLKQNIFVSEQVTDYAIEALEAAKKALIAIEAVAEKERRKPRRPVVEKIIKEQKVRVEKKPPVQKEIRARLNAAPATMARHLENHPGVDTEPLVEALTELKTWKLKNKFSDGLTRSGFKSLSIAEMLKAEKPEVIVMHEALRLHTEMGKNPHKFGGAVTAELDAIIDNLFDALIKAYYPGQSKTRLALTRQYEHAVNEIVVFFNANRTDGNQKAVPSSERAAVAAAKVEMFETPRPLPWITMNEEGFEGRMAWLGSKARTAGVIHSGRTYSHHGDDVTVQQKTASDWMGLMFQLRTAHRQVQKHIVSVAAGANLQ